MVLAQPSAKRFARALSEAPFKVLFCAESLLEEGSVGTGDCSQVELASIGIVSE